MLDSNRLISLQRSGKNKLGDEMENIVDEFKKYAKELGVLYKTKRELDSLIDKYEEKLKKLGKNLELADSFESSFNSNSAYLANP
jgi:cell shape-determining protein MreC